MATGIKSPTGNLRLRPKRRVLRAGGWGMNEGENAGCEGAGAAADDAAATAAAFVEIEHGGEFVAPFPQSDTQLHQLL